jgi:hypothetical protein
MRHDSIGSANNWWLNFAEVQRLAVLVQRGVETAVCDATIDLVPPA